MSSHTATGAESTSSNAVTVPGSPAQDDTPRGNAGPTRRLPFGTTMPLAIGVPVGKSPTSGIGVLADVGSADLPSSLHAARTRATAARTHPTQFLRAAVPTPGDIRTPKPSVGVSRVTWTGRGRLAPQRRRV